MVEDRAIMSAKYCLPVPATFKAFKAFHYQCGSFYPIMGLFTPVPPPVGVLGGGLRRLCLLSQPWSGADTRTDGDNCSLEHDVLGMRCGILILLANTYSYFVGCVYFQVPAEHDRRHAENPVVTRLSVHQLRRRSGERCP